MAKVFHDKWWPRFKRDLFSKRSLWLIFQGFIWWLLITIIAGWLGFEVSWKLILLLIVSSFIDRMTYTPRREAEVDKALTIYHESLTKRMHGGVAAARLVDAVERAYNRYWS